MSSTKTLICVVGPTAIGKTDLAIELASSLNTEIISADSRQFFKEMNIGTAVPSPKDLIKVRHHFIQHKSIHDFYTVGDFERDALEKLKELFKKHDFVVMVGGSGLYVDAVVNGLNEFPNVPHEIRTDLNNDFHRHGIVFLQNELKEVDPDYFKTVDINNPQRIIRALEIYRATNKKFSSFLNKPKEPRFFKTIFIGLEATRETIYSRINQRVDLMIDKGLIEEARELFNYKDLNALQTVGYRELFSYFEGLITKKEAIEEIKKNTRRFSKRQLTWFKKNKQIDWFDYKTDPSVIINEINIKRPE